MTMVCSVTPIERTALTARMPGPLAAGAERAAALAPATRATAITAVGRLAAKTRGLLADLAARRHLRLDARALEGLPFDLRKDLGWPAGDMRR